MKSHLLLTFISASVLIACSGNDEPTQDLSEKPTGSNKATCVYNNAYNEDYDPDPITLITSQAKNSYVLLEPFDPAIPAATITVIQSNGNEVGAYISIGTGESWRSDFDQLKPYLVSKQWGEWEGEYFVNTTTTGIVEVMKARIDKLAELGYDWIEFDNMDWVFDDDYRKEYGFVTTVQQGIDYSNTLCDYVHSKGMKCMAKNSTEGVSQFDGVLYESYNDDKDWWDVSGAKSFLKAGKLVIINHYNESSCNKVYTDYMNEYGTDLSFICESTVTKAYVHYNDK